MLVNKELKKWILFVPEGEIGDVEQLLKQLKSAGASVNLNVLPPVAVYVEHINKIMLLLTTLILIKSLKMTKTSCNFLHLGSATVTIGFSPGSGTS